MSISGIGSGTPAKSNDIDNSQSAIKQLEQRRKNLSNEIRRVEKDKNLTAEQIQKKVATLQKQMVNIDTQIQNLQQPKNTEVQSSNEVQSSKVSEESKTEKVISAKQKFDTYESGDDSEQIDNTYKVTQEDGEKKVQFNRPDEKQTKN